MLTDDESRALQGAEVYDDADSKIGTVGQVWADTTGKPSWVSINTGLFGYNETLMPLLGAYVADGVLHTPYAKNLVVAARTSTSTPNSRWTATACRTCTRTTP